MMWTGQREQRVGEGGRFKIGEWIKKLIGDMNVAKMKSGA